MSLYFNSALISILWGIGPVIQKILLVDFSAVVLMVLGSVIYLLCIICYGYYHREEVSKAIYKVTHKHIFLLLVSVVFSGFLANRLYYVTLKSHSVGIVTVLTATFPLLTVILSYLILSEKVKLLSGIGIFIVCIGIGLIGYSDYYTENFTLKDLVK